jgi:hypothetical protein
VAVLVGLALFVELCVIVGVFVIVPKPGVQVFEIVGDGVFVCVAVNVGVAVKLGVGVLVDVIVKV